jgi:hypothetical protein
MSWLSHFRSSKPAKVKVRARTPPPPTSVRLNNVQLRLDHPAISLKLRERIAHGLYERQEAKCILLDLAKDSVIYSRARYSEFIPLWRSVFREENLLILPYTDVGKHPLQLLRKVEAFIGAGHGDYTDAGAKVYETSNKQTRVPPQVRAHLTEELAQETRYFETLQFS